MRRLGEEAKVELETELLTRAIEISHSLNDPTNHKSKLSAKFSGAGGGDCILITGARHIDKTEGQACCSCEMCKKWEKVMRTCEENGLLVLKTDVL